MVKLLCPFTFGVNSHKLKRSELSRFRFLISKFYEINKKFHQIELVTDVESHKLLRYMEFDSIRYVHTSNFDFVDDFKIFLLEELLENEVIIDFDVYLKKPLHIDNKHDLIIERYEEAFAEGIYRDLIKKSDISFKKEFYLRISNLNAVPNIGVFKINNRELLKKYLTVYDIKRREIKFKAIEQGLDYKKYSVLIGQLTLRHILNNSVYSVFDTKSSPDNYYTHLNGETKYTCSIDHLEKLLGKVTLI